MSLKVNINNIHLKLQCDSDSDKEGSPSNLRKNAFKALQEIEAEFLKFKDILIEDKLREIEKEIDMLNNSNLLNCLSSSISKSDYFNFEHDVKLTPTELSQFNSLNEQSGNIQQENLQHPLYLKKLKLLELKKMEKFQILEQERKCKLRNVSNKFEEEQLSIRCTYKVTCL
ncbi:hypothetical protein HDU92_002454 [Lobulomyces angularis]|nr:hypothetical protein HDU92_002454 [Lobulomyces angularis]